MFLKRLNFFFINTSTIDLTIDKLSLDEKESTVICLKKKQ